MRFHFPAFASLFLLATHASARSLSTRALSPDSSSLLKREDACSSGYFAPVLYIGASAGSSFCETSIKTSGEIIKSLQVWYDSSGIRGILFTLTKGKSKMHGNGGSGESKTITFAPGELVSYAKLWGNGKGEHLGHIYLKTDKQEFDVGMTADFKGYEINVGGGLLLGAAGQEDGGDFVKGLAWIFLDKKIDRIDIGDIHYTDDPSGTSKNIVADSILEHTFGNPKGSTGNVTFAFTGEKTVTKTTTWEQSTKGTFGMSLSVEWSGEVFGIGAKVTGGFEWSVEHSTSSGGSESTATKVGDTITVSIAPGYGKKCKIVTQHGEGDFDYTSVVKMKLEGGGEFSYSEKGTLKSVQYSDAKGSCVDANNPIDWDGTPDNPPVGIKLLEKPEGEPASKPTVPGAVL